MKTLKKGIPKLRLPEGLEGVVRMGKVSHVHKDFFVVDTKNHGPYIFKKEYSRIFNSPTERERVFCCFYGQGKTVYFPYKVCNKENTRIFYEEK